MTPLDIIPIVIVVVGVTAILWLAANSRRHESGLADFIATWLATSLLVFIVGGGLMMFGVAVLLFLFGREVASFGLVVLVVVLIAEPFAVAFLLHRRRSRAVGG